MARPSAAPGRRFFLCVAVPLVLLLIVAGLLVMPAKRSVSLSVRVDVGLAWFAALSTLVLVPTDIAHALQARPCWLPDRRAVPEGLPDAGGRTGAGRQADAAQRVVARRVLVRLCRAVHRAALPPGARRPLRPQTRPPCAMRETAAP